MGFDVIPAITADWTNNPDALETTSSQRGTALIDAVCTARHDKEKALQSSVPAVRRGCVESS